MLNILFLFILILISFTVGRRILRLCKICFGSQIEEFVFSTGIGLGLVSYLTLALGLIGILYKWTCLILLAILFCFTLWEIWRSRDFFHTIFKDRIHPKREDAFEWSLLVILIIGISLSLLASLAPPTDWDSGVYHLAIPKLWIQNHQVVYIPYILASEFPLTIETLYALGMAITDDVSASLIIWAIGVLIVLAVFSFCQRSLNARIGLLASTALCVAPLFSKFSMGTLIDSAVGFYAFLGLYAFLIYRDTNSNRILMLAGVMSGLSAACKHSGLIPFIVLLVGVIVIGIKRRKKNKKWIWYVVLFVLVFLAIIAPWYIKSYINTGNPTVIYFTKLFGGQNLLPEDMSSLIMSWRDRQVYKSELFLAQLASPLRLLLRMFLREKFLWSIGVFFLAFAPILAMGKGINKAVKYSLIYSAIGFVLYSIVTDQPRLVTPIFPGLFIAGAYGAYGLMSNGNSLRKAIQIIILLSLLLNIIPIFKAASIRYPVAVGLQTREQYLESWIDIYETAEYVSSKLSDDVRILTMDPRGYYLDKPYIAGSPITQGFIRYGGIKSAPQLLVMLKEYGITHLLVKKGPWTVPYANDLMPYMTLIHSSNDVYLFQLNSYSATKSISQ
jgi:hypothetical protein